MTQPSADVPHDLLQAALAVVKEVGLETEWGTNDKRVRAEEEQRRILTRVLPLHEQRVRAQIADAIADTDDACGAPVCECCRLQRAVDLAIARGGGHG